jgi:ribosomal protein L7/L12
VQKLKDAPIGERIYLRANEIVVAPEEEFSTSLVLEEETSAARDFAREDLEGNIAQLLPQFDGRNLVEAATAVKEAHGISVTKAKDLIKKLVETSQGAILLERANKNNSRSGLIVRFDRAHYSNPTPETEF